MSLPEPAKRALAPALVLLVGVLLLSFGASQRVIQHRDEQRYAEVAREMTLPDASWLVPRLNGQVYTQKPPGFFWATAAVERATGVGFGPAGEWVSVIAGAITLALVFALGRRLYGPRAGLAAAGVLCSSAQFLSLAKRVDLDALLAAFTTAALYAAWRAEGDDGVAPGRAARWRLAAGGLAGLAVLVKGPVAIAVPAAALAAWALAWRRESRIGLRPWLPALGVAVLVPSLWLVAATLDAGAGYAWEILIRQAAGHPFGTGGKLRPWWFYGRALPPAFAPWIVLLPAALLLALRRERRAADGFVAAWAIAPLVLLSLFPAKRHLYLLPVLPGAALLVGAWIDWLSREPRLGAAPRALRLASAAGQGLLAGAAVAAGAGVAVALAFEAAGHGAVLPWPAPLREAFHGALEASPASFVATATAAAALLVLAGGTLARARSGSRVLRGHLAVGLGVALLIGGVVHPVESAGHDAREFYGRVAQRVGTDELIAYEGMDHAPNLLLLRAPIRHVDRRDAEACIRQASREGRTVWILAEEDELREEGAPAGARVIERFAPPLDTALVLLRAGGSGAAADGAAPHTASSPG